ncbi:hypothetical protein R2Q81_11300 [Microbacterium aquimaris]|mgnify:CR=1 FL=1|uniref:hypothetical protein n=1 Tax=Microbacterium aquimaris TaxID=459816 RepID=UPI002AD1ECCD|nr:hypothetical protein [Microbacterium aquimaris]MDZ8276528.1 hypothetical protein [Microbacterium aquimaris]|tara:strand:+ start:337 stop:906 length:570 start_codon:yes stop_codon:yes gene_type:complete
MTARKIIVGATSGALLVGSVIAGASMATASDPPDFSDLHDAQQRIATSDDALPDTLLKSGQAVDFAVDTARHLTESARASYWSVLKKDGDLCLVVAPLDGEIVGGSCASREAFSLHGIMFAIQDSAHPDESFGAYLIPDSLATATMPFGVERAGTSVVEVPLPEGAAPKMVIESGDSRVELREIVEPPK